MKKNDNSAWSEFVFEDETWKEDNAKEIQHAQKTSKEHSEARA